jgi:hypothetical protein
MRMRHGMKMAKGNTPEPTMRKAAREFTLVAIAITAIAILTGAARLANHHKADPPLNIFQWRAR